MSSWFSDCFSQSMPKRTPSAESKPAGTDGAYKPWPGVRQGAQGEKPLNMIAFHARFNPQLVGFGIAGPEADAANGVERDGSTEGRK
jgi:hypothetical protein